MKMQLRHIAGMVLVASTVTASAAIISTTVTEERASGYFTSPGGEFTLKGIPASYWDNYSPLALRPGGFQTFCLELNEGLTGQPFAAELSYNAIKGGVGGGSPDPLSIGAAWLYAQFATGTLPFYDYNPLAGRAASAKALQETIWWLEDELTTAPVNPFTALVTAQFVSPKADYDPTTAGFHVAVVNLWDEDAGGNWTIPKQDMLIYLPDGGLTLALLGCGLLGLAAIRRRD